MEAQRRPGRPALLWTAYLNVSRNRGSLYVAELTDGAIKIGFTDNPRTRLPAMDREARRAFGSKVHRFHVYDGVGAKIDLDRASMQARLLEWRCIHSLNEVAVARAPFKEYFDGVSFDAARQLIEGEIELALKAA